ncbi:MAG: sugar diacid recognition domain-containing protein [Marinobacter sp.]|uniref:CdaR family transcriptional regulator n=1 Tax=unclassified Marinobacter TaxID=83889 RepID=UPI00273BF2EA|nr:MULTISPECIES: sugar diacid recognition domain-containing protein [unclassified Marinobacter]MDP4548641.1 sugar diacid recognition domain-containing protein [Marinobacter sp. MDS2]
MTTLDQATAQRIVDRAMPVIGHSVNVMTPDGIIIASGDSLRVGAMHQAARQVAETCAPVVITEQEACRYTGTRAGVNLPVEVAGKIVAVVGISGTPEKVLPFADLVRVTAELILEQASLIEVSRQRRQQIENTLLALLNGEPVSQHWLEQLSIDLSKPRIAVVFETSQPDLPWLSDITSLARALERIEPEALVMQTPDRKIVFFFIEKSPQDAMNTALARLPQNLGDATSAATGAVFSNNLQACYESAEAALQAAKQRFPAPVRGHYEDFPLATLWRSLQPKWQQEQLNRALRPLRNHARSDQYLKTLRAFISSDGDIQRCAQQLHLHRNSVRYRLKGIEALTGFSPFRLEDLALLYLALESN